ncbi:MAG: serine/threonine-protein phosphatase [Comamonadaceae bacterium]|nr:MAG: serine/threonine-protein phosphatase [Comamonadaceae bacterium]
MSSPGAIRIEAASFSHEGGRSYNEDFLGECEAVGALRLFVLADGAGGQGGGDVAAKTAVAAAQAAFRQLPVFSAETIRRCIQHAGQAVVERQKDESRLAQMASTVVMLLVSYQRSAALLGNLGDSRCYVFRGRQVAAQSLDHSVVQRFVDAGLYPADMLRAHPKRNVLYASLGANQDLTPPYFSEEPVPLQPGDGVLLCSDGVWELLQDVELGELHASSTNAQDWRDRLEAAVQACMPTGHDNYSAFLLRCLPAQSSDEDTIPPGVRAAWAAET